MELFSVCTSVYKNDKAEFVLEALKSITVRQSLKPTEVIIVVDGPVSEGVEDVISGLRESLPDVIRVIRFEQNQGLGLALQKGMEAARYDIVLRMDSDDVAEPLRFEKQIKYMTEHPDVAVCGGQIEEFIGTADNVVGRRIVPCSNEEIYAYMKTRCGFNHMTVALRRQKVLEAGNYIPWFWNEDYYLWIRMMEKGFQFANLPDKLVNVRVGKDMYARRGGIKYFKSEVKLQKYMYEHGVIGGGIFVVNILKRLIVQVLLPNSLRGWVFRKFART